MASQAANLWVLLGLGLAGILMLTKKLKKTVREDFGAFIDKLMLLPPPQPAPPKAPHPLTGLTFAVSDVWVSVDLFPPFFSHMFIISIFGGLAEWFFPWVESKFCLTNVGICVDSTRNLLRRTTCLILSFRKYGWLILSRFTENCVCCRFKCVCVCVCVC